MLRIARVAAVHPEDHSVDLVMVDDGSRHAGAQVMAGSASSSSGTYDMPTPSTPASGDKWSLTESTDCDIIAVCAMVGRNPLVLGFLYPQVSQMLFKDPNRRVQRHASDVYSTIDGQGNFEFAFPNGLYFRVGSSPEHEDLSSKDVDGKWKASKNTGAQLHVHVEMPGKFKFDAAPNGDVNVETATEATVKAATKVTLDTPLTHVTGNLQLDGALLVGGAGGGAAATIGGDMNVAGNVGVTGNVDVGGSVTDGDGDGGA